MREIYDRMDAAVDTVDDIAVAIACILLFALMLVVVADVALRYAFNAPLAWSYEVISNFLMPGLFFLSVSHTLRANAHVPVDIVHNYLSTRTRYILEAISHLLSTPVFAAVTWFALARTIEQFKSGNQLASGLELPTWTTTALLPIGFGLLTLRALLKAVGFAASIGAKQPFTDLPVISGMEENYE